MSNFAIEGNVILTHSSSTSPIVIIMTDVIEEKTIPSFGEFTMSGAQVGSNVTMPNTTWVLDAGFRSRYHGQTAADVLVGNLPLVCIQALIQIAMVVTSLLVICAARDPRVSRGASNVQQLALASWISLVAGVYTSLNILYVLVIDGPMESVFVCNLYAVTQNAFTVMIYW